MTPWLPGTGIGGLFYLLLVLFMPLREALRVLRGCGDVRAGAPFGGKLALAGGILAALWLEGWVLFEVFGLRQDSLAASAGASATARPSSPPGRASQRAREGTTDAGAASWPEITSTSRGWPRPRS